MQTCSIVRLSPHAMFNVKRAGVIGSTLCCLLASSACGSGLPDEMVGSTTSALTAEDCTNGSVGGKDTICHHTSSKTNPYTLISLASQACVNAHTRHEGDFLASSEAGCACVPHAASCKGVAVGCCGGEQCDVATLTCQVVPVCTTLRFDTLPSAQGWSYVPSADPSILESAVFSVTGTALVQNSIGIGNNAAPHYELPGVVDPSHPFTLSMRARVLQEEIFSGFFNRFGFTVGATTDNQEFDFGISSLGLEDENGMFFNPAFDVTQFHDYRVEITPGVGYQLFIDNAPAANGTPSALGDTPKTLILGDESQNNAHVEITRFEYCSQP